MAQNTLQEGAAELIFMIFDKNKFLLQILLTAALSSHTHQSVNLSVFFLLLNLVLK